MEVGRNLVSPECIATNPTSVAVFGFPQCRFRSAYHTNRLEAISHSPRPFPLRRLVIYIARLQDDGLVQERRNSSALAMEFRLSCINPSKYSNCASTLQSCAHQVRTTHQSINHSVVINKTFWLVMCNQIFYLTFMLSNIKCSDAVISWTVITIAIRNWIHVLKWIRCPYFYSFVAHV